MSDLEGVIELSGDDSELSHEGRDVLSYNPSPRHSDARVETMGPLELTPRQELVPETAASAAASRGDDAA